MFKIFKGEWRGPGATKDELFVQIGVNFRQYLKHFTGNEWLVFTAIALHMDENGLAYPSYDKLKEETGLGRDTISRILNKLCEKQIDGSPVLMRWRERDDDGKFKGSNRYKIFPTPDELNQSPDNPTLDEANSGSSQLEEEPSSKEEPKDSPDANAPVAHPIQEQTAQPPQEKSPAKKRKKDPVFEALCEMANGVPYAEASKGQISYTRAIMREVNAHPALKEQPPTPDELLTFPDRFAAACPTLTIPDDPRKVAKWIAELRTTADRPAAPAKPLLYRTSDGRHVTLAEMIAAEAA